MSIAFPRRLQPAPASHSGSPTPTSGSQGPDAASARSPLSAAANPEAAAGAPEPSQPAAALRPIAALQIPDVDPAPPATEPPRFEPVAPTRLLVDETYQRNLSERSVTLIRRIVATWDWRAFKPPVVVDAGDGRFHVIDGQHTAIAAASRGMETIPVQIVEAGLQEDRAKAFVRHNRDRINVTPTQLHHALVAAGDEDALTIAQVLERAGVRLLKFPPGAGRYQPGDFMGVSTLRSLIGRRHAAGARRVLQVCAEAKLTPISAAVVRAVECLLYDEEYAGQVADGDLTTTLREMGGDDVERAGKLIAAAHKCPLWRGVAVTLFRNTRKVRRGSRAEA